MDQKNTYPIQSDKSYAASTFTPWLALTARRTLPRPLEAYLPVAVA
jgi:hypothetical protein